MKTFITMALVGGLVGVLIGMAIAAPLSAIKSMAKQHSPTLFVLLSG